ncbi:Purine catabolism regulatory protein [compost metagenome]
MSAPWLPQNLHDATEAFHKVLGGLAEYDKAQHAPLVHTLRTFLENNRSWVNTALKLHIHKQTLVYRVRRIEDITGRSLDSTDDVSILWFALKAADLAGALAKRTSGSMASAQAEENYKAVG